jgi:hypothetical protein
LRWFANEHNVQVQSAESAEGEVKVQVGKQEYSLDGVVSSHFIVNTQNVVIQIRDSNGTATKILEFMGCLQHGCLHYTDRDTPLLGLETANQLYAKTMSRIRTLEEATGLPVEVVWECEWDARLADNPQLQSQVQQIELIESLNPRRDALRGGKSKKNKL